MENICSLGVWGYKGRSDCMGVDITEFKVHFLGLVHTWSQVLGPKSLLVNVCNWTLRAWKLGLIPSHGVPSLLRSMCAIIC